MTYPEAIDFLRGLQLFGTTFGLENTQRLARLVGDPQNRLRFIHVAGTNGKGSTCAILENIYRLAGLKVGLYTSPHLVSFSERIQVNHTPISEPEVVRLVETLAALCMTENGDISREDWNFRPTFFEFVTVMALLHFVEQTCDLVVWETGLGGRFDATNIVIPLASVITNIQYDHERWLGNTLASIAAEKAGIIKAALPTVAAVDAIDALEVIRAKAAAVDSPLRIVTDFDLTQPPLNTAQLALFGNHQKRNAALALATIQILQPQLHVLPEVIVRGLETVKWPGRFQEITHASGALMILDGAHNPAGANALRQALNTRFPRRNLTFILGMLKDKAWEEICDILAPLASKLFLVAVHNERTVDPIQVEAHCRKINARAEIHPCQDFSMALAAAIPYPPVIITGSLYFIGEALQQLTASPPSNETVLNAWNASKST